MTSKTSESKSTSRAASTAPIQAKLNVNKPGDRYEVEADRAAASVMSHIEGKSKNTDAGPASPDISRLQNGGNQDQQQQCGEEEALQMKIQRQAEEEEEEMQLKVQRQPEEEEEELQMKVQRQAEEEEEELIQPKEAGPGTSTHGTSSQVESRISQRRGQGSTLDSNVKGEMESGFGADFSSVRVHNDAEASKMSSDINAQAFTTGNDIYFNEGKYQPDSSSGKSLLAHELTHVIQQNGGTNEVARKSAAGELVEEKPVADIAGNPPQEKHISGQAETEIQREVGDTTDTGPSGDTADAGDASPQDDSAPPPDPASPTLNITPGNTLTRGETLKATIMFQPNGAETYNVISWRFATADHGNIDRPATESEFQNKWDGKMAVSGTLTVTFRITPESGTEGPDQTLVEEITVEDRTGDDWESEVDEQPEIPYAGSPSPPTRFPHLGQHQANVTNPDPDLETIGSGPNKNLRFVNTLAAGTYTSQAQIHPDLLNDTSNFYTFHMNAGILYLVSGNARTEIPRTEYSNLEIGEDSISFDVPDWEAFYKSHDIARVVAFNEDETTTFVVPETAWELDANDEDAGANITD